MSRFLEVAIALGQFNRVRGWFDPHARSTPDDLRGELTRQPPPRVVFETCS